MTDAPTCGVMLFGTDEQPAETRILTAGPLTAELDAGNLRYIRFGGHEAIRAISYVTRDQYWGTDAPAIHDLQIDETPDSFTVTYAATCARGTESYSYKARITGAPTGLRFEVTGAGDTDFLTCRTGFVVLHGVEGIVGEALNVEHVDGSVTNSVFPEIIDPDCPFRDIRALTHTVAPGAQVRCEMTGDTFEMEDQRNWTDASFKTYVRPLSLPQPYTIEAGEVVEQAVTLTFEGAAPSLASASDEVTVTVGAQDGEIPQIGMWMDARDTASTATQLGLLGDLRPAFLNCYLDTTKQGADEAFVGLGDIARALQAPLSLEVVVPGDDPKSELVAVARAAHGADVSFRDVAVSLAGDLAFIPPGTVFPDMRGFETLYAAARSAFPDALIGGGNFVYFTELNRKPVPSGALDFVVHGASALVHAADDRSVTETLECLPYVFASMRASYDDKPYRVSPAGIGSRTSPFGNDPTPNPDAERVTMTDRDPRQRSLLGAAWHLGFVARAAEGKVDSLALGAPTGGFGLVHTPMDNTQPWFDQTGGVFPAYHIMQALYAASGAARFTTSVSAPRDVQAVAFEAKGAREVWLANLTPETKTVAVRGLRIQSTMAIDQLTFESIAQGRGELDSNTHTSGDSVTLRPYACMQLS